MTGKRGRPPGPSPLSEADAREFGLLVLRERDQGETLDALFSRLHRNAPQRWKSRSHMWRLWGAFKQALPDHLDRYVKCRQPPTPPGATFVVNIISVPSCFFLSEEDIKKRKTPPIK
jgi:hypothetical protein